VRHGLADAEGVADREHDVADQQLVGIGKVERGEFLFSVLHAQHGQIGAAVLEHDLGFEFALVGERDLDLIGALDDVVVGDHQTGSIDHHARSERALHLLGLLAGHAEEAAEDRVVQQRVAVLHGLGGIDVHHRRLRPLRDRRIGQPQFGARGRHAPVLRQRRRCNDCRGQQQGERTDQIHAKILEFGAPHIDARRQREKIMWTQ
jgi:hypothetical protein